MLSLISVCVGKSADRDSGCEKSVYRWQHLCVIHSLVKMLLVLLICDGFLVCRRQFRVL